MKRILITGATAGIGEATARQLVKEGNTVLLTGRNEDKLQKLADELGDNTSFAVLDVNDGESIKKLFANLPKEFEKLDVVINNAGLALGTEPAPDTLVEDWDTMIETNIKGLTRVTHAAVKLMTPERKGHIINLSSIAGLAPYRGGNVYGATKAYVTHFSKNLRADLFDSNIRITAIHPGAVNTEFSTTRFKGDKAKADAVYENYRELVAEDIAESIVWAINRPEHVNIDAIDIMPTDQTYAGLTTTPNNK